MKTKQNKTRRGTQLATVAELNDSINENCISVLTAPLGKQKMTALLMEVTSC
ncbi:MAG: hypothetical protein KAH23_06955 [Kiritimatiellae bacterium]|nr:hypothetical protein [Kiritimatiellia bacterium]